MKVDGDTLRQIVTETGTYLTEQLGTDTLEVNFKDRCDLVSSADRAAEKMLITSLVAVEDTPVLSEEYNPDTDFGSEPLWIIDPLDGTTNYINEIPLYAVSVAHYNGREIDVAACYIPTTDEFFSARKGTGSFLNGHHIHVSSVNNPMDAVVATGFADITKGGLGRTPGLFIEMVHSTRAVRRIGSAVIDLLYTAAGRFDLFWEAGLSPWDVAAGSLIVSEAGGIVSDYSGGTDFIGGGTIIASNRELYAQSLDLIQKHTQSDQNT